MIPFQGFMARIPLLRTARRFSGRKSTQWAGIRAISHLLLRIPPSGGHLAVPWKICRICPNLLEGRGLARKLAAASCRSSSARQSNAFVMRGSRVRIPSAAPSTRQPPPPLCPQTRRRTIPSACSRCRTQRRAGLQQLHGLSFGADCHPAGTDPRGLGRIAGLDDRRAGHAGAGFRRQRRAARLSDQALRSRPTEFPAKLARIRSFSALDSPVPVPDSGSRRA